MRRVPLIATVFVVVASQAFAWHDAGHKLVASIAFRQLSAEKQAKFIELLKHHPRYAEEFTANVPAGLSSTEVAEWSAQQAAVFPDIARTYPDDLKARYHRGPWHYINVPEFLTNADRAALHPEADLNLELTPPDELGDNSNVIQVIRAARRAIADTEVSESDRALMLSWLLHTVGDVHQPLHSTALFSRGLFRHGDHGGNSVATVQKGNLHSLWDDFPGGRLKFSTIRNRAVATLNDQALVGLGQQAATDLNEETWLNESQAIAVSAVYDPEVMAALRHRDEAHRDIEHEPIDLSEDYLRTGAAIAEKRVVQAGFRLGAILSELLD